MEAGIILLGFDLCNFRVSGHPSVAGEVGAGCLPCKLILMIVTGPFQGQLSPT